MLETFRRGGIVQVFLGGVVLLIIAAFALDFRSPGTGYEAECVVEVGDSCVPGRDFTAVFQLSVRPDLTPKQIRQLQIRKMLIDGLVERELLLDEARRLGISISEEEVDQQLALGRFHFSLPAERDGQLPMLTYVNVRHPETEAFNYEIYQRAVRNYARMSTKDFKAHQKNELTAARMRELAKIGANISEAEAYAMFEQSRSKATVRVARVPLDWFARFGTALSDDQVQAYAAGHAAEVDAAFAAREAAFTEGCPLVSEIFFAFPPAADETDEAETRARAERVAAQAARASEGEFGLLARVHSAAPTASQGGKRGCLSESEGEEAKQLLQAVEGLAPGAVSQLIELPRGFHLLRLEGRLEKDDAGHVGRQWVARPLAVADHARSLAQQFAEGVREAVSSGQNMQEVLDARAGEAIARAVEALGVTTAGPVKPSELEAAAKDSRDKPEVEVSSSFTRLGPGSPVPDAVAGDAVKHMAFGLAQIGDVHPELIPTHAGFAVMQLKDKEPAKPEDFEEEKREFIAELESRAQSDALAAFVDRLKKAREDEISINQRYLEDKGAEDDS